MKYLKWAAMLLAVLLVLALIGFAYASYASERMLSRQVTTHRVDFPVVNDPQKTHKNGQVAWTARPGQKTAPDGDAARLRPWVGSKGDFVTPVVGVRI
jgi:uncharacterized protein (DUF58 family)